MPWVHAPAFLIVRCPKTSIRSMTGGREIIEAFRTSDPQYAAEILNRVKSLEEWQAEHNGATPLYDYELYRLVKGGGYGGKHDAIPYPYGFEITREGKLHFWCFPYHHTYHIDKIEGEIPQDVVGAGVDAVEEHVYQLAEAAIAGSSQGKTVTDERYDQVRAIFHDLQRRR